MKCIRCGNETYKSTTTEAIELNGGVLVIRNIPCYKCEICDEIHFTGDVVKKIEQIIGKKIKRGSLPPELTPPKTKNNKISSEKNENNKRNNKRRPFKGKPKHKKAQTET